MLDRFMTVNIASDVLRILIVDDSVEDRELIRRLLIAGCKRKYEFIESATGAECLRLCLETGQAPPDCVLVNYHLPDYDAPQLLAALAVHDFPCCPVVVTGIVDGLDIPKMMRLGAQDFIGKAWLNSESLTSAVEIAIARYSIGHKQIEVALQQSEQKYRSQSQRISEVIWATNIGTWEWNVQTDEVEFNERWAEIIGYSLAELWPVSIDTWLQYAHPDDLERSNELLQHCFNRESDRYEFETRMRHKNGDWIWVLDRGRVVEWSEDGKPLRMSGTHQDITERKLAEFALRESEQRFRNIIDASPIPYALNDDSQNIIYLNRAFTQTFGYTLEDIPRLADWWPKAYPDPEYRDWVAQAWQLTLEKAKREGGEFEPQELIICCKGGEKRTVIVSAVSLTDTFEGIHMVTLYDITERKFYETSVAESRNLLMAVINTAPIRVFWKDSDLRYLGCNKAFAMDAGMAEPDDLIGKDDYQMGWAEQADLYRADDRAVMESGLTKLSFDEPQTTPSGQRMWLRTSKVPLKSKDHEIIGVLGIYEDITDRKNVEQALQESESRFRTMANAAPVLIWVAGTDKRCHWFNKVWLDFTGRTMEEERGVGWIKGVHPDDLNRCLEVFTTHFDWREPFQMEYRLRRHDGEYRWMSDHGVPLIDEQGNFTGYIGSCLDVTPSKELTIKLRKTLKDLGTQTTRLQTILETANDGIHLLDMQGNIVQFSHSFAEMLGYSHEEMVKLNVVDWEAQIPKDRQIDIIKGLINQSARFETKHRRKDGSILDVEISAKGVLLEGDNYFYASSRDISNRKALENQLLASTEEIEDLYDNAPCGYHSLGPEGTYQRINETELSWLGCNREEVIGKLKPDDFFTPTSQMQFKKAFARIKRTGHVQNAEFDLVGRNGNMRHVSLSATAIFDIDGNYLKSRSVFHDITELKKFKDKLEQLSQEQQAMLDSELIGIAKVRNRRIIWKNRAMDRIFGYGPNELKGRLTKQLFPDESAYQALGETAYPALNNQGIYRSQVQMIKKDGSKVWIDLSGTLLTKETNESLWMLADITQIKEYQDNLEKIAFHDALTGLPNRLLVIDRLNQALAQAERLDQMLAVCYLDLDGFKPVNDTYGHAAGDTLLIEIAHRLQASIRVNDTVGRIGGDEFVLLLTNLENNDEYHSILERVIESIKQPVILGEIQRATVSTSMGVSLFPQDAVDPGILLRYADQALYRAKQNGRNRYQFYDLKLEQVEVKKHEQLEHVKRGLAFGEFRLFFQPKVDFDCLSLAGMEALIRWQHPDLGLLEPGQFLPDVENNDMALVMGDWAIREALSTIQIWQENGIRLPVSINTFARQLHNPCFVSNLQQICSDYPNVPPNLLQIEITENAALPDLAVIQKIITDCNLLGIRFSIDDFGTGYSSLLYLRHLTAQELKIDQSFVNGMLVNRQDLAIVEGIIGLGAAFERSVIAEGVETPAQIHRLLSLGCKLMQGNVIANPMPAEKIIDWVRDFQAERFLVSN